MLMSLITKKNQPTKTKVQFTHKEFNKLPKLVKLMYEKAAEKQETTKYINFIFNGDLINQK